MTFTFLAVYLGGALLILFVGGLLVRADIYRRVAESRGTSYPRSRLLEDLRPVQATMVQFIAESPRFREFMQGLANSDGPIPLRGLFGSTRAVEASWTALFIMGVAGLLQVGRCGVKLTSVGREILARIDGANIDTSPRELKAAESNIRRLDVAAVPFQPGAALAKVA